MAERAPLPPSQPSAPQPPRRPTLNLHDPVISHPPPAFESGTYIVQVRKDQIYRVPPAENALIVKQHRNPVQNKRTCYCSFCFCCLLFFAAAVIAIVLGISLSVALFESENPEFKIQRFVVKNKATSDDRDYGITLKVKNPNKKSGILYMEGGFASLFYKKHKLADGTFPTFHQEEKNSKGVNMVLKGRESKITKPKTNVSFSLTMKIPAKMKTSRFATGDVKFVIKCDFMVDKILAKGTKILQQRCQSKR